MSNAVENLISESTVQIHAIADTCVKCAMCSSACPTYQAYGNENESPRGRIALAQTLASKKLTSLDTIQKHLEHCLHCGNCETTCPSGVLFSRLITNAKFLLRQKSSNNKTLKSRLIQDISFRAHKKWHSPLRLLRLLQMSGLLKLVKFIPQFHTASRVLSLLPTLNTKIEDRLAAPHASKESIQLFTGCMSHIFQQQSLLIAQRFLSKGGVRALIKPNQVCCGSYALHKGHKEIYERCKSLNEEEYSGNEFPIVFLTGGCGATLKQYDNDKNISPKIIDVNQYLIQLISDRQLAFRPLNGKIMIHVACSERNSLKQGNLIKQLLNHIPQAQLFEIAAATACCGASGGHFIDQYEDASQFREPILQQIDTLKPDYIVSSNYPCALHIQLGLKEKNLDIPVLHPIELMYKQLEQEQLNS